MFIWPEIECCWGGKDPLHKIESDGSNGPTAAFVWDCSAIGLRKSYQFRTERVSRVKNEGAQSTVSPQQSDLTDFSALVRSLGRLSRLASKLRHLTE
jgi:hypothetical protein